MLRALLMALAALAFAFAACGSDDDEVLPAISPSPSPTAAADAVVICPRIGVPGEATPSSPTPVPSCEPGQDFSAPPGIRGVVSDPPPLPSGTTAISDFIEFNMDYTYTMAVVSLPAKPLGTAAAMTDALTVGGRPAWYTWESGAWRELRETIGVARSADGSQTMLSGSFDPIPLNLIALVEP